MKDSYRKHNQRLHIVIGCGRLGASVASMLSTRGIEVIAVDISKDAFINLSPSFTGFTIEADACDTHILESADIKKAGTVLVATGDDNVNIMISQIAKLIYEVPVVVARLYDTDKEALLTGSGIGVIYPVKLEIEAFRELIGMTMED
jgi:trk system potassium uptake protein TrkA